MDDGHWLTHSLGLTNPAVASGNRGNGHVERDMSGLETQ